MQEIKCYILSIFCQMSWFCCTHQSGPRCLTHAWTNSAETMLLFSAEHDFLSEADCNDYKVRHASRMCTLKIIGVCCLGSAVISGERWSCNSRFRVIFFFSFLYFFTKAGVDLTAFALYPTLDKFCQGSGSAEDLLRPASGSL